jgi:hypothetical protein
LFTAFWYAPELLTIGIDQLIYQITHVYVIPVCDRHHG